MINYDLDIVFPDESTDQFKVNYYDTCKILREHAQSVFNELKEVYKFPVDTNILPIVFYSICKDGKKENIQVSGENIFNVLNKKQNQINIYNVSLMKIESLKRTVRHEVIHYCLEMSNLKSGDDSAAFHAFCEKYDANPYKKLSETEQKLFERYNVTLRYVNSHYDKSDNRFSSIEINLMYELGLADSNQQKFLNAIYKEALLMSDSPNT